MSGSTTTLGLLAERIPDWLNFWVIVIIGMISGSLGEIVNILMVYQKKEYVDLAGEMRSEYDKLQVLCDMAKDPVAPKTIEEKSETESENIALDTEEKSEDKSADETKEQESEEEDDVPAPADSEKQVSAVLVKTKKEHEASLKDASGSSKDSKKTKVSVTARIKSLKASLMEKNDRLSKMKMKSSIATSIVYIANYRFLLKQWSGVVVGTVPFEPVFLFKGIVRQGLTNESIVENPRVCSAMFIFFMSSQISRTLFTKLVPAPQVPSLPNSMLASAWLDSDSLTP